MNKRLEKLYGSANISDALLNPTYGVMMRRKPVYIVTQASQAELKDLAALAFRDIRGDEWFSQHIPMATYRMFIKGFADGTFRGSSLISRAECLTMLARFNHTEEMIKQKAEADIQKRAQFAGLVGNEWYTDYVIVASEAMPYPEQITREFILKPMTRGEVFHALAATLWRDDIEANGRYYETALINKNPAFSDTQKVTFLINPQGEEGSFWWFNQLEDAVKNPERGVPMDFYPAIFCLKDKGILLGNNGSSKWNSSITRAEVLALFERLAAVWGKETE
ncbi:MAG: S-layer homology domain-containing protein [Thermoclostridium sp.]|nr:S-layer homology domain-containing protein [Thermoclostridium sp.]